MAAEGASGQKLDERSGLMRLEERIVYNAVGLIDVSQPAGESEALPDAPAASAEADAPAEADAGDGDAAVDGHASASSVGDQPASAQPAVRALLISSSLEQADALAEAARADVVTVRYNGENEAPDGVLAKLEAALGERRAASIALASHATEGQGIHVAGTEALRLETLEEPAMAAFWEGLAGLVAPKGRIDLLACGGAAGPDGDALIQALENSADIEVAASQDPTGNPDEGGDWILETDGIDAGALYFDAAQLLSVEGLLQNEAPDNIFLTDSTPAAMQGSALLLTDTGASANAAFGSSLDIDGARLIVGAPGAGPKGEALVYEWDGSEWVQQADPIAPDGFGGSDDGVRFGTAVATDAGWVAVGDPEDAGSDKAYFHTVQWDGDSWEGQHRPGAASEQYGASVTLEGEWAFVGAPGGDSGEIYHFSLVPLPNWAKVGSLDDPDGLSADGDQFGASMDVSGNWLLVGAPKEDGSGADAGAVYAYHQNGGTWSYADTLGGSGLGSGDQFGASVSVSGDTAVVGAPGSGVAGAAYVFTYSGGTWSQVATLTPSDEAAGDAFGTSVAAADRTLVIGAPGADVNGKTDAGAAYVFRDFGGAWSEADKVVAANPAASDHFGQSVAALQDTAIVGAPGDDTAQGANAGSVTRFLAEPEVPENSAAGTVVATVSGTDPDGDSLAFALTGGATDVFALSGNKLVVRSGAGLDFESQTSHTVWIEARDPTGATTERPFVIHVSDVLEGSPPPPSPPPPSEPPPGGDEIELPEAGEELGLEEAERDSGEEAWFDEGLAELAGLDFSFADGAAVTPEEEEVEAGEQTDLMLQPAEIDLTLRLTDLAFNEDALFADSQPPEIREAFDTILQAYTTSSDELAAYLQSAFRSVAESALVHRSSELAEGAARGLLGAVENDPVLAHALPGLIDELDEAQLALRNATENLRVAVVDAAGTGEGGFDQAFQDVVTAAQVSLDQANARLLVATRTVDIVTTTLRHHEAQAPEAVVSEEGWERLAKNARTSAQTDVAAARKPWDRASEDVFTAFVKRLVAERR